MCPLFETHHPMATGREMQLRPFKWIQEGTQGHNSTTRARNRHTMPLRCSNPPYSNGRQINWVKHREKCHHRKIVLAPCPMLQPSAHRQDMTV
jgi:hypothetical protein